MLGLFKKKKVEPPQPMEIPFPEELTNQMREYADKNVWFNNWIAKFQSGEEFKKFNDEEKQQIYRAVFRIYKEIEDSQKPKVKYFFTLTQEQAERFYNYLNKNDMTIEEFVLHALEKLDQEQP